MWVVALTSQSNDAASPSEQQSCNVSSCPAKHSSICCTHGRLPSTRLHQGGGNQVWGLHLTSQSVPHSSEPTLCQVLCCVHRTCASLAVCRVRCPPSGCQSRGWNQGLRCPPLGARMLSAPQSRAPKLLSPAQSWSLPLLFLLLWCLKWSACCRQVCRLSVLSSHA